MTMGRRVEIERKEGGKVESRTRKKSRMEKGEVNGGGVKEDEEERAGGSLPALRTAKCIVWGKWSEVLTPQLAAPTTTSPNFSLIQPQRQPHSTVFPKRARLYSWPY